jgi:hypothetical protein
VSGRIGFSEFGRWRRLWNPDPRLSVGGRSPPEPEEPPAWDRSGLDAREPGRDAPLLLRPDRVKLPRLLNGLDGAREVEGVSWGELPFGECTLRAPSDSRSSLSAHEESSLRGGTSSAPPSPGLWPVGDPGLDGPRETGGVIECGECRGGVLCPLRPPLLAYNGRYPDEPVALLPESAMATRSYTWLL